MTHVFVITAPKSIHKSHTRPTAHKGKHLCKQNLSEVNTRHKKIYEARSNKTLLQTGHICNRKVQTSQDSTPSTHTNTHTSYRYLDIILSPSMVFM